MPKFISITGLYPTNCDTIVNCAEIASIQEFYKEDDDQQVYSKIILKSGAEVIVPEAAQKMYEAIQSIDESFVDLVDV